MKKDITKEEVDNYRMTEWLNAEGRCGMTSYERVVTNAGWCRAEVEWLQRKKVRAVMIRHDGRVAIYKIPYGIAKDDFEATVCLSLES